MRSKHAVILVAFLGLAAAAIAQPTVTVDPPGLQRIEMASPDTLTTGDVIVLVATATGWRADLVPIGNAVICGDEVPFRSLANGLYIADHAVPADSTKTVTASVPGLYFEDEKGKRSRTYTLSEQTIHVWRYAVATARWADDGDTNRVCLKDGKFYRLYVGTEPGVYPRVDESRPFAVGDSLQWRVPGLLIGETYYFKLEELYEGWTEGNMSPEVGYLIKRDGTEKIE